MENQKPSMLGPLGAGTPSKLSILSDAIDDFLMTKRLERCSRRTEANYRYMLAPFLEVVGGQTAMGELSPKVIKQYLLISQQRPGEWSHRARYNSLRVFLRWAVREGYMDYNPLTARPPKMPRRVIPIFTDQDLRNMLKAATERTSRKIGLRDKAVLMVLMDTGMRLNELSGMRAEHINWETGAISIMPAIAKGEKARTVVLSNATLLAIAKYLRVRSSPLEALWLSEERRPLTRSGVQQIVRRVSKQALGKVAGPHRFRHTYACNYLANGGTIDSLRYLLGHSSLAMVLHYAEATKARRAVDEAQRWSPVERLGLKG